MDGDADHLRHGPKRRTSVEQILVKVLDAPVRWRSCRKAAQRQSRCEHVLAEAGVGVLGIEGIDQQRVMRFERYPRFVGIKSRHNSHLRWKPAPGNVTKEGFAGCDHECTLQCKVHCVNETIMERRHSRPPSLTP